VEAAGRVLAETALERTRVTQAALRYLGNGSPSPTPAPTWQELWR